MLKIENASVKHIFRVTFSEKEITGLSTPRCESQGERGGLWEEAKAPVRMLLRAAVREAGWEDAASPPPRPLQRHPPSSRQRLTHRGGWRRHWGAGGLSDRDRFLPGTGSAFLKAELLTSAASDLLGREVHLAGPQEGGERRAAALC